MNRTFLTAALLLSMTGTAWPQVQDLKVLDPTSPESMGLQLDESSSALWNEAYEALSQEDYGRAREKLEALLALHYHPAVLTQLGIVLVKMGDVERGIELFREAIRLDPEVQPAYLNLGAVLMALGQYDEALESLTRAYRLEPTDRLASVNIALVLGMRTLMANMKALEQGNPMLFTRGQRDDLGKALYLVGELVARQPDFLNAQGTLGILCAICGDVTGMEKAFAKMESLGWDAKELEILQTTWAPLAALQQGHNPPIEPVPF